MFRYGLQTHFHARRAHDAALLAGVVARGFTHARLDVMEAETVEQANACGAEAERAGLQPLSIVDDGPSATTLGEVEVLNEPDGKISVEEYVETVVRVIEQRRGMAGRVWIGAFSNLNARGQGFWRSLSRHLPRLVEVATEAGVVLGISFHHYPVTDYFEKPQDRLKKWGLVIRYASRDAEVLDFLKYRPAGMPWMVTEFGYHTLRQSAAHAATEIRKEWAYWLQWASSGCVGAFLFQIRRATPQHPKDYESLFGIYSDEEGWMPAADTVPGERPKPIVVPPSSLATRINCTLLGTPDPLPVLIVDTAPDLPYPARLESPTRAIFTLPANTPPHGATIHGPTPAVRLALPGEPGDYEGPILEYARRQEARLGPVRLAGRSLVDDGGAWLGLGTSLFWAGWGWLHDRGRLDENLACAAGERPGHEAVDYLRVLACVGHPGVSGTWQDRAITADDILSTDVVAELTDHAYDRYGLRLQWTIFGGVDTATTPAIREAVVRRVGAQLRDRVHKVLYVEIGNESWQNGFSGGEGRAELFRLAETLRAVLPTTLIALTDSRQDGEFSRGSVADLQPVHLERDISGAGGRLRPVRQAREVVEQPWAWVSQEPIGIDSSVAAEDDPERLTLSALYTWLCKGCAYTLHTGAGIRGGGAADLARGRKANLWEQPTYAATIAALRAARAVLPNDLPNFTWHNSNSNYPGFPFRCEHGGSPKVIAPETQLLRAFAAIAADGRMVCIPLGVMASTEFVAAREMAFERRAVLTGTVVDRVTLTVGQAYTVPPGQGWILIGRVR